MLNDLSDPSRARHSRSFARRIPQSQGMYVICMYIYVSIFVISFVMTSNSVLQRFGKLEFGVQVLTTGHWPNYKTVVRKNKYAIIHAYMHTCILH